ncbi:MAG: TraB/GumN family protein [Lysobacter sp.]
MRMMIFSCLLALLPFNQALAQGAVHSGVPASTDAITDMDAVVVSGVQPGPGMWKISKAGHVLWVLGVQSPLPRKMQWHSPEVEAAIAQSQEVLNQPGISIGMNAGGMFRAMFAMPTLLKVRKLPDDQTLQDVLPPDLYARWSQMKPRYLGRDKDVEQWRPVFAAQALYDAAIRQAGLENAGAIAAQVAQLARRHDVQVTSTSLSALVTQPKALAKSFARSPIDDVACFRATLDRLESDVATTVARANAWAVGDVEEMARLTPASDMRTCVKAITDAEVARSLGLDDAEARIEAKWLAAAEAALARNQSSFALLSVPHLLSARSFLARLAAKGYTVEAPQ